MGRERKRVLLVGDERATARFVAAYRANGLEPDMVSPGDAPAVSAEELRLVHVVDAGAGGLLGLADDLLPLGAPLALPFYPTMPLDDFEPFVVRCEAAKLPLMLAYPPLYAPAFHKLKHAVKTGIVGRVREFTLALPGGPDQFRRELLAGGSRMPAIVGLAYAALIAEEPLAWETGDDGAPELAAQLGRSGQRFVVAACPEQCGTSFTVRGDASSLRLESDGRKQTVWAQRGEVERVLSHFDDVDLHCATVKASQLFVDRRTRNVVAGHAGLYLAQVMAGARKACGPATQPDPPPPPPVLERFPQEPTPPPIDLYRKLPVHWGGEGPATPLWEAKFNIETVCNQDCLFCFARERDLQVTSPDQVPLLLGRLTAEGVEGVMFSGREPTLNRRLPDFIAQAKAAGMRNVTVETNALLFAEDDLATRCRDAGLDAAFVSFHSPSPDTTELLTKTPGSYQRTLQGVRNLLDCGVEVELNCVINRHNVAELEELARFVATELPRVTSLTFSFVAPLGRAEENRDLVPRISEVAPVLRRALLQAESAGLTALVPGRCGIPLCFLPGLERFFVDFRLRHHVSTAEAGDSTDRVKTALCGECRFDTVCQGLWRNYASLYGTDEIRDGFWRINRDRDDA